jgi:type II secretion system protein J
VNRPTRPVFRAHAFTLLELLVATSIFSILIAALYAVLFGGIRLRETAWEDFESGVGREQVARVLERDLAQVVVPAGILAGPLLGETQTTDQERTDRLEFYAASGPVTDDEPWGDIQKIEYFLEEPIDDTNEEGFDFVRRVQRDLLATVVEEEEIPEPEWRLLSGVTAMTIQYYDGAEWVDSWDTTTVENENPEGIRLRLDFASESDGRVRPPLEIVSAISQQPRPTASGSGTSGEGTAPETPSQGGGEGSGASVPGGGS